MATRPSQSIAGKIHGNALDYEIAQEQAAALGRLGRALETALIALAAYDAGESMSGKSAEPSGKSRRTVLLERAGYALWCFVVQREACGLRDQRTVFRDYCVPSEVRNRMGVFPAGPAQPGR